MMNGIWYTAGIVNPTIALLSAHCQNLTENAVRIFPKISVDKHIKNDFFLPILKKMNVQIKILNNYYNETD